MKRSKADAEATRLNLLRAALKVFNAKGFRGATLDDIASAARVTRGAIYHHFKNKAAIYQTLLAESSVKSRALVPAAIAAGGSFQAIIERVFHLQLMQLDADPDMRSQALFALRGDYAAVPAVRREISQRHSNTMQLLTQTFAEAQARGEVRADLAPRDLARMFVALQNGLLHLSSLPGQASAISESVAAFARMFIDGLQPTRKSG